MHAQTAANVASLDPAYQWVAILAGAGLITSDFPEERPWNRMEFARLTREAEERFASLFPESLNDNAMPLKKYIQKKNQRRFIRSILDALRNKFRTDLGPRKTVDLESLEWIRVQYLALGQNPQPTFGEPPSSGQFHPLINNLEGRHYYKDTNLDIQTSHSLMLSPYLALFARPQLEFTQTGSAIATNIYPKTLALQVGWRNVELEIGRDQIIWGDTPNGGLTFSDNPRGLDMIKLSSPHPFHFPGIFKKIGDFKITTLFATMGPQYVPSYSWMTATHLSWHITPNIRIAADHQLTFGGDGYSIPGPGNMFLEYLGVPTNAGNPDRGGDPTNRSYTGYLTFRIPKAWGTELGVQLYFEDKTYSNSELQFRHNMAYMGSLKIPRLGGSSRWMANILYEYVGSNPYEHGNYPSGWALNQEFLAQTNGPDTQTVDAKLTYFISPYSQLMAEAVYIRRLSNVYAFSGTVNNFQSITTVASGPVEEHYLGFIGIQTNLGQGLILNAQAGIDFIQNAYFQAGNSINPGLVKINLSWYPYLRHY